MKRVFKRRFLNLECDISPKIGSKTWWPGGQFGKSRSPLAMAVARKCSLLDPRCRRCRVAAPCPICPLDLLWWLCRCATCARRPVLVRRYLRSCRGSSTCLVVVLRRRSFEECPWADNLDLGRRRQEGRCWGSHLIAVVVWPGRLLILPRRLLSLFRRHSETSTCCVVCMAFLLLHPFERRGRRRVARTCRLL